MTFNIALLLCLLAGIGLAGCDPKGRSAATDKVLASVHGDPLSAAQREAWGQKHIDTLTNLDRRLNDRFFAGELTIHGLLPEDIASSETPPADDNVLILTHAVGPGGVVDDQSMFAFVGPASEAKDAGEGMKLVDGWVRLSMGPRPAADASAGRVVQLQKHYEVREADRDEGAGVSADASHAGFVLAELSGSEREQRCSDPERVIDDNATSAFTASSILTTGSELVEALGLPLAQGAGNACAMKRVSRDACEGIFLLGWKSSFHAGGHAIARHFSDGFCPDRARPLLCASEWLVWSPPRSESATGNTPAPTHVRYLVSSDARSGPVHLRVLGKPASAGIEAASVWFGDTFSREALIARNGGAADGWRGLGDRLWLRAEQKDGGLVLKVDHAIREEPTAPSSDGFSGRRWVVQDARLSCW